MFLKKNANTPEYQSKQAQPCSLATRWPVGKKGEQRRKGNKARGERRENGKAVKSKRKRKRESEIREKGQEKERERERGREKE